ncbi:hypothetical protein SH661x_001822 [Planctomicrobium sp. SH661]|uniref:hypothetical protein n=1 Tax=Planctomicrobium sp. SH661 TaxID=3448124 RepID=UPI003F5B5015
MLAALIAALLFIRRDTFARLAYLISAGLIVFAACGTGPLAYLAGWLALPPLFVIMGTKTGNNG